MAGLRPVAFDIETTGFDPEASITVAGLSSSAGAWIVLNTDGRSVERDSLETELQDDVDRVVKLAVSTDETQLLTAIARFASSHLDGDRHYLTAFHGEVWNGGFDLPFVRRACIRCNVGWPFPEVPYADVQTTLDRIDTGDVNDLVGTYDELIGGTHCDPFTDSGEAVTAYENGDWLPLLRHNLADIERTRQLAELAGRYVPKSDFRMKNLAPPDG